MATESLVALRDRRDQVIAQVSDAYASDVIDVDELDRRLDLAHSARSLAELDALVADLAPVAQPAGTALVVAAPRAIDDPTRADRKRLRCIMSSIERRSGWVVPRDLEVRVFWGSVELDFREASLGPGTTTLDVRVTMASLEIILPPWLPIDCDVSSIMGSVEERHRVPREPDPQAPLLRVVGRVTMGSLEIITRLPGETAGDARRRWRRERRERRRALRADGRSPAALPPGQPNE